MKENSKNNPGDSVKKFQQALKSANGNKALMEKTFRDISQFMAASAAERESGQNLSDFLNENPEVKKMHEWSTTVLIGNDYTLYNY